MRSAATDWRSLALLVRLLLVSKLLWWVISWKRKIELQYSAPVRRKMKTGRVINTLQIIYKIFRYVVKMHDLLAVTETQHDFCSGPVVLTLVPPGCPVSSLSPREACLKRQRAAWGRGGCVRSRHMALFISPCRHYCGSEGEGHHSGKACWDTWTVSRSPAGARDPCGVWRDLLLGDAGSCLGAARKPTYGPLVLVRTRQDVFQHLHFNSSSVFKWRTTAR